MNRDKIFSACWRLTNANMWFGLMSPPYHKTIVTDQLYITDRYIHIKISFIPRREYKAKPAIGRGVQTSNRNSKLNT